MMSAAAAGHGQRLVGIKVDRAGPLKGCFGAVVWSFIHLLLRFKLS